MRSRASNKYVVRFAIGDFECSAIVDAASEHDAIEVFSTQYEEKPLSVEIYDGDFSFQNS